MTFWKLAASYNAFAAGYYEHRLHGGNWWFWMVTGALPLVFVIGDLILKRGQK